jgi:hypothetical protein
MIRRSLVVLVVLAFVAVACKKEGGGGEAVAKYPGTEEGAKQLLTDIRTGDAAAMTKALKPTSADYKAVFEGDAAAKAEAAYEKLWSDPKAVIGAKPENTELLLSKATTDDLKKWTAEAEASFPGGYKRVAEKLKPGLTVYRWKYTKPGEKLGMSFDGLIHVNGRWAWFPKPWRAVGGDE